VRVTKLKQTECADVAASPSAKDGAPPKSSAAGRCSVWGFVSQHERRLLAKEALRAIRALTDFTDLARGTANELYISYNTVKTHTRTIYRKLGLPAREETIERARALGLI